MDELTHILIVEDVATDAELVERELRKAHIAFTSQRVETKESFNKSLMEFQPDIILSDYGLPQFSGLEALSLLKEKEIRLPFILVTGSLSEEIAVLCMKEGATDYILKSNLTRLPSAVQSALKRSQTEKEKLEALEALRKSQEQLRQAQKLEAVGRLAAGIAHDFNNLLTVIGGYTDLLLSNRDLDDSAREKMEEVSQAAQRAASLVKQLLAFSRKSELHPEVLDPNSLIEGLGKMLQRLIGSNIQIDTRLHAAVGKINADRGQFEQVLINLVLNARDAMPTGGTISIVTDNVELAPNNPVAQLAVPGPYVMLEVSDTGIGMDAETQQQIFEPFFTTKAEGEGTGLGLSMIYGIVTQSGGTISVYTQLGEGTTFTIYLPRVNVENKPLESTGQYEEDTGTAGTILLVEDEDRVRQLAYDILSARGYSVLSARDGGEAIAISKGHCGPIDLLLTDLVMPGVGEANVADSLKAHRDEMEVLYMSRSIDDVIVSHGPIATNFIEKPFTAQKLETKVRQLLARNRDIN